MTANRVALLLLFSLIVPELNSSDGSLTAWQSLSEVTPAAGAQGLCKVTLDPETLEQARDDLSDLRLIDANGREVPFATLVRREVDEARKIQTREFNRATAGGGISELTVDLGEGAGIHNEVEIDTAGNNYRRQVELDGSDDAQTWRVLNANGILFSFEASNKRVESNKINYPVSRYRYLRARVSQDTLVDRAAPEIESIEVLMTVKDTGEAVTWAVAVPAVQPVRSEGSPASAWTIDLGHRVPCNRIILHAFDQSFSRPYSIELADDLQDVRLISSGEITHRSGDQGKPTEINFDEVHARRLRLIVTDFANPTLSIMSIEASAPARQLLFEMNGSLLPPFSLYSGNPTADAPRYDFEKELPSKLSVKALDCAIGPLKPNPYYKPEPKPLTERLPWLIYGVLAISSIALALILLNLIRSARRAGQEPESQPVS